jgi:hypothetical protein
MGPWSAPIRFQVLVDPLCSHWMEWQVAYLATFAMHLQMTNAAAFLQVVDIQHSCLLTTQAVV